MSYIISQISPLSKDFCHIDAIHMDSLHLELNEIIRMNKGSSTLITNIVLLQCVSPQECLELESMGGEFSTFITFIV